MNLDDVQLGDVDGKPVSLTDYAGAPLVVQIARYYG